MIFIQKLRGYGEGAVAIDVRYHSESKLLRFAPWTKRAWVTINGVVFLPAGLSPVTLFEKGGRDSILAHEYCHVLQQKRLGWIPFLLLYALLPIPWLAPWRVWLEAEAYAHEVVFYGRDEEQCVEALAGGLYFFPLPKPVVRWMIRRAAVKKLEVKL